MKTSTLKSLFVAIGVLFLVVGLASAQPPARPGGGPMGVSGFAGPGAPADHARGGGREGRSGPNPVVVMAKYLDLSEAQIADIRAILEEKKAALDALAEEVKQNRQELKTAIEAEPPSPQEIGTIVLELHGLRQERKALHEEIRSAVLALLTPAQQVKMEVLEGVAALEPVIHAARKLGLFEPPEMPPAPAGD